MCLALRLRRVPAVCGRSAAGGARGILRATVMERPIRFRRIPLATTRQDIIHLLVTTRLATPHRQRAVRQAAVILAEALRACPIPASGRHLQER